MDKTQFSRTLLPVTYAVMPSRSSVSQSSESLLTAISEAALVSDQPHTKIQRLKSHGLRTKRASQASSTPRCAQRGFTLAQTATFPFTQTKLKALSQGVEGVIWIINASGRFLLWGGRGLHKLNIQAEERERLLVWDVYAGKPDILAAFRRAFKGEEVMLRVELSGRIWEVFMHALRGAHHQVVAVVGTAHDVTDHLHIEAKIQHLGLYDTLTGLANRTLFTERVRLAIERARASENELFAVVMLDLDRFKIVNESLGHEQGDTLLRAVACRLKQSGHVAKTLARLGGDEFALLLQVSGVGCASAFAEELHAVLAAPFDLNGIPFVCGASLGIAVWDNTYQHPEEMLRDAELAMYRAKQSGRGRHQVFGSEMHTRAVRLLQMEADLRHALVNDGLLLHYQPIVELRGGRIVGFEALVRWQQDGKGLVSPSEFIPLAEDTGLIESLGTWVLRRACAQMQEWRAMLPTAEHLNVSVNVSNRQFATPHLVHEVQRALKASGLPPANLKLEITESTLMDNAESAIEMLHELSALGIRASIDDFGTGYSSLAMLTRFPLAQLKIDRSFVQTLSDHSLGIEVRLRNALQTGYSGNHHGSAIVRTVINLANTLKLSAVAEGIESPLQLQILRDAGCTYGQGFLFARPLPAADIPIFLREFSLEQRIANNAER